MSPHPRTEQAGDCRKKDRYAAEIAIKRRHCLPYGDCGWHGACISKSICRSIGDDPMLHLVLTCLLLSVASGLSMRRFLLPYFPGGDLADKSAPVTIVANAVFLATIAFTVSDQNLWAKSVIVMLGVLLAAMFDDARPKLTIALSAVSLATYLGLRSII
jgi:hypothetical protein